MLCLIRACVNAELVLGIAGLNQLLSSAVEHWIMELECLHVTAVATHDGKDERAVKRCRTNRNLLSDDHASSNGVNGKPEHLENSAVYVICKLL